MIGLEFATFALPVRLESLTYHVRSEGSDPVHESVRDFPQHARRDPPVPVIGQVDGWPNHHADPRRWPEPGAQHGSAARSALDPGGKDGDAASQGEQGRARFARSQAAVARL
jgi:hypothetical protein